MFRKDLHIAVIGDVMLDKYIYGEVHRKSPEADVPVIEYGKEVTNAGGAANVAIGINKLGAKASLFGIIGEDPEAQIIEESMKENDVDFFMIRDKSRPTTSKTRLIADGKHITRVDKESRKELEEEKWQKCLISFGEAHQANPIDLVIFQDYNKGLLHKNSIDAFINLLLELNIPYMVDPKHDNFFEYKNALLFKPNFNEFKKAVGLTELKISDLKSVSRELSNKIGSKINLITLGERGLFIDDGKEAMILEGYQSDDIDVCGAGDAVISVAAMAWCSKMNIKELAKVCNQVGFISCLELGVNPISLKKLQKLAPSLNQDIKINYV